MRDNEPLTLRPTYCGKPHRTVDGLPLAHRCRVLPPEALRAEASGESHTAFLLFARQAAAGQMASHSSRSMSRHAVAGVWKVRRGH
jgi:hypothetical protein